MTVTLPLVSQQRALPNQRPAVDAWPRIAHGPTCTACGHPESLHGDRAVSACDHRTHGQMGLNWQRCSCNGWSNTMNYPTYDTKTLNNYAAECHAANQHWWHDPVTGERLDRNKGELLMLIVSEVAEAMEGERKDLPDDHLPHRSMAEVELADVLIRVFDYAGAYGYDLEGAYREKRAYNAQRADHRAEARMAANGKKW